MGYITEDYYNNTYHGETVSSGLTVLIDRASDVVDYVTRYKIGDITSQPTFVSDLIKKATAAQVEYMDSNGGTSSGNVRGVTSCSIGKFSYSEGSSDDKKSGLSPVMLSYLEHTGLLYRG